MLRELVRHFDGTTELPIEVPDIQERIKASGRVGEINFLPDPAMDVGIARGFLDRYQNGYRTPPVEVADIYYAKGLTLDWERLVWTKELMNIGDTLEQLAATAESVSKLVAEMVLPPGLGEEPALSDRVALVWALLVLFPKAHRDLLLPHLQTGKTSIAELAKLACIPERYIPWVMSEAYNTWHKRLVG